MGSINNTVNYSTCRSLLSFPPLLPPPSLPRKAMLPRLCTLMSLLCTLTPTLCKMITLIATLVPKKGGMGPIPRDLTMSPCLMVAYRRLPTLSVEMVAMWLMSPMKELLSILRTSLMSLLLLTPLPSRYGGNKHHYIKLLINFTHITYFNLIYHNFR